MRCRSHRTCFDLTTLVNKEPKDRLQQRFRTVTTYSNQASCVFIAIVWHSACKHVRSCEACFPAVALCVPIRVNEISTLVAPTTVELGKERCEAVPTR